MKTDHSTHTERFRPLKWKDGNRGTHTMHNLGIHPVRLSDGSTVFNVSIGSEMFHCVTEKDALTFIEIVNQALAHHTNDEARIVYYETTGV